MPMSVEFEARLLEALPKIMKYHSTPFHVYDEIGIRKTGNHLKKCFSDYKQGFKEFFAVKALPDPAILRIMKDMGFGFDCSSIPEVIMARKAGAKPEDIMFTSNNTTEEEFRVALADGGCILNLDDISFLDKEYWENDLEFPEMICFRLNPGDRKTGNAIIGNPVESKYGITWDQIIPAYIKARNMGANRFGLHTMVCSNDLDYRNHVDTVRMLLEVADMLDSQLGIKLEFINIGGGIGIQYKPFDLVDYFMTALKNIIRIMFRKKTKPIEYNLEEMAKEVKEILNDHSANPPKLFMESGRFMTGPHGVLVNRAINRKDIYQTHIGVQTAMPGLMRPAMYDAYHHITVYGNNLVPKLKSDSKSETVNIVGSICENIDRLATGRELPLIFCHEKKGDIVVTHDVGAHGAAMGFNYNGRTRPAGFLIKVDGDVVMTRRAETVEDLLARTKGL